MGRRLCAGLATKLEGDAKWWRAVMHKIIQALTIGRNIVL